jgi:uncharacterized Ntn-hydrolase superfamily protein
MTFSIAAFDRTTGDVGVAVASKFPAVGAVVPWLEAGVGAVATQSFVNARYGPDGLDLLRTGESPTKAAELLTRADEGRAVRQLGMVDCNGGSATFTGDECLDWAGGVCGDGFAIQGNLLAGAHVVAAMEQAWLASAEAPFVDCLMAALLAGDRAGGDRRGRQSSSIHIKRKGAGYGGVTDQLIDLRVDDHVDPVPELQRLIDIHMLLFGTTPKSEWIVIDHAVAETIRGALHAQGTKIATAGPWNADVEEALKAWVINENMDERWSGGDEIDPVVLDHLLSTE